MRKHILLLTPFVVASTLFVSCSKSFPDRPLLLPTQAAHPNGPEKKNPGSMPQRQIDLSGFTIISTQTFESPGHQYRLITYLDANNQEKTIVIEIIFYANNYEETKTYRCEGSSCDCRVEIYESLPGEYSVRCACTPCTLIIE